MVEDSGQAKFNEAALQMKRYDALQMELHKLRVSPFSVNSEHQTYNFQVQRAIIDGIFLEVSAKLTGGEPSEISKVQKKVTEATKALVLISADRWKYNNDKKYDLTSSLFQYELLVRKALSKHGISTPNVSVEHGGFD